MHDRIYLLFSPLRIGRQYFRQSVRAKKRKFPNQKNRHVFAFPVNSFPMSFDCQWRWVCFISAKLIVESLTKLFRKALKEVFALIKAAKFGTKFASVWSFFFFGGGGLGDVQWICPWVSLSKPITRQNVTNTTLPTLRYDSLLIKSFTCTWWLLPAFAAAGEGEGGRN